MGHRRSRSTSPRSSRRSTTSTSAASCSTCRPDRWPSTPVTKAVVSPCLYSPRVWAPNCRSRVHAPFVETGGEFDTDEFFFEGVAPIFSEDMNIPGFHTLEINGAVREIDNSQSGTSTVWSAGGNWKPIRTLNIRGNYTESIRAPSLVELFAPISPSRSASPTIRVTSASSTRVRIRNSVGQLYCGRHRRSGRLHVQHRQRHGSAYRR